MMVLGVHDFFGSFLIPFETKIKYIDLKIKVKYAYETTKTYGCTA